jgi:AMMECR1 domain-containing protein
MVAGIQPISAQVVARFQADRTGAGEAALHLARQALASYCLTRTRLPVPDHLPPLLYEHAGVFVSAQVNGAPRCCMGFLRPHGPSLAADVVAAAVAAAAHDERFPPLQPAELARIRLIVSVLDPPQAVADPFALDPLTDGLAVRSARRVGVVLPGETGLQERFVTWAVIRAAAAEGERVEYFRLNAIRFAEPVCPPAEMGR